MLFMSEEGTEQGGFINPIEASPYRVRRNRQRPPSNGFIESAPEHRARARFSYNARFR
jgi:hypothetical protein